ncbi:hypothetical protein WMY93_009266 [Mugilogobius chulae]|uniref:Uncharacterized protein n=1 Tax=Mugilogobius chulae TaxID=88201 RepID=A0AAW0PPV0_9GOBI
MEEHEAGCGLNGTVIIDEDRNQINATQTVVCPGDAPMNQSQNDAALTSELNGSSSCLNVCLSCDESLPFTAFYNRDSAGQSLWRVDREEEEENSPGRVTAGRLSRRRMPALLAALTDSLDGMVDAEVGGLSVFPALEEEEPGSDQDSLPLNQDFSQTLDSEDPSLLKKLLLTPPNVPAGIDTNKDGVQSHRYSNRSQRLVKPLVKVDLPLEQRKPRAEDEEEEEEEEESESEEEEEGDSSSSEVEPNAARPQSEPAKPQFSSEKELQSVVDLITYMHTYCLPSASSRAAGIAETETRRGAERGLLTPPRSKRTLTLGWFLWRRQGPACQRRRTLAGLFLLTLTAPKEDSFARRREPEQRRSSVQAKSSSSANATPKADNSSPDRSSSSTDISLDAVAGGQRVVFGTQVQALGLFPESFRQKASPDEAVVVEKREDKSEEKLAPKLTKLRRLW